MAQYRHLPIYKATYDLLLRVTEVTRHYPRDFKFFAAQIRNEIMEIILLIYRANSYRAKRAALLEAVIEHMQVVELALQLSRDMQFISTKQFSSVVELTDSILRQAQGWRSASGSAE